MKRDDLKELNLPDDAIDKIMAMHGKDVQSLNNQVNDLKAERDTLKGQTDDFKKQVDDLTKNAKNSADAQNEVSKLQEQFKESEKQWSDKLNSVKTGNAIELALRDAGVKDTRTVIPLLDRDLIKLNDKGQLEGLKDQLPAIQKDHGYLFNQKEQENPQPKQRVEFPTGNPNANKDESLVDKIARRMAQNSR